MKTSAKHVLNTNSDTLNLSDEFYQFFDLYQGSSIILKDNIEDFDHLEILINYLNIERDRDVDDLVFNEFIPSFHVYNKITKEQVEIKDKNGSSFYLSEELFNLFVEKKKLQITKKLQEHKKLTDDDCIIKISFADLETKHTSAVNARKYDLKEDGEEDGLADEFTITAFWVRVANDELTKPLKDLTGFIEKGQELKVETYSELIDMLRKLFAKCGIASSSLSVEIITRNLIRDADNIISRVDWTQEDPKYKITSVHNSILKSNSILNSLTFERLMQQFRDPLTFQKDGTSFVDLFFIK